jgi:ankyrin repeat protein
MKLLLASNADVNAKDSYGKTPLQWAADRGYMDVVELLLDNKADVNAKDKMGNTSLAVATAGGHKDVADLLRQHGGTE